jgi:SAM-dependent methyltransferase
VLSEVPAGVDPTTPSPARMYDYLLGGTLSLPVDRAAADRLKVSVPDLEDGVWANRGFHQRAALWLADHGISQFIDLGSGLPTQNNTHDAVHSVLPGAHVVYVDHDPVVAAYSSALLAGDGTTTLIAADICDPPAVLGNEALRALIDLSQPVGLLMTAVLHFVTDEADPWNVVRQYLAALAPGSYLALSHFTADNLPPAMIEAAVRVYSGATTAIHPRSRAQVQQFFAGLHLVPPYDGAEPALTHVGLWGAEDQEAADSDGSRGLYCGVARRD